PPVAPEEVPPAEETEEVLPEPEEPVISVSEEPKEAAPEAIVEPPQQEAVEQQEALEEKAFAAEEALEEEEEAFEEEYEEDYQETQMDVYLESLRNKVIEFLQDAFHSEGIVYSADIIDEFVTSEQRDELFRQFVEEHYVNPGKGRILTDEDLIKCTIALAEPTLNDKILDPSCGTGEFLVQILETLDTQLQDAEWTERDFSIRYELRNGQFYFVQMNEEEREYFEIPLEDEVARWLPIIRFCKQQQLTGVDSDRFAYRTADLNVALQGFPEIVMHHANALTSKLIGSGVYDMVIGAPPVSEDLPTRFLRRSLVLAKPGGKILLLLPDDMFTEFRLKSGSLRNQLASQAIVRAVIRLPESPDPNRYGPQRTLFYCLRKHRETEQQTDIFVGEIDEIADLQELIDVLEDPEVPVSQSDEPLAGELVTHILSLYQGSAYNLLLEGLRRRILQGDMLSIKDWTHLPKSHPDEE
ncbi:N-6 DNA methylase, partial [candidate division KSB3 bacterium]|nr:N-6 DNA methylase [candidate division KSB3 bacterium]